MSEETKQYGTAPRITMEDIEANIVAEYYANGAGAFSNNTMPVGHYTALNMLTLCVLVLRNGFTVTGESACVSLENFNPQIGRKIAREKAIEKIWPLMGYALKNQLNNAAD